MTCIIGLKHGEAVYIGSDSIGVDSSTLSMAARVDRKIYVNGPFVMGFTSSYRMGQLLGFTFAPPIIDTSIDLFHYMVRDFIPAVRECFMAGGCASKDNNVERGGDFLVGVQNRLFAVHSDFQVNEPAGDFYACGCGADMALGSLYTSDGLDPQYRMHTALKAAETFSAGVGGPFFGADTESRTLYPVTKS